MENLDFSTSWIIDFLHSRYTRKTRAIHLLTLVFSYIYASTYVWKKIMFYTEILTWKSWFAKYFTREKKATNQLFSYFSTYIFKKHSSRINNGKNIFYCKIISNYTKYLVNTLINYFLEKLVLCIVAVPQWAEIWKKCNLEKPHCLPQRLKSTLKK